MGNTQHNNISKKQPPTRGIPSKESLWLADLRKLRESWRYHQNVRLEMDQIMHIVFPQQYQQKYYEVARDFMQSLLKNTEMRGEDIGLFLQEKKHSKATFYNVILPRLKRVGMVKLEREAFHHDKEKQKYYKKIVRPSKQFSIFFQHLAREYEAIIETAKTRTSAPI